MELGEIITTRRDVRKYRNDPIPEDRMLKLYEALRLAPSGNNHQPYKFIFVFDKEKREQIAGRACHQKFLYEPPVLMVACCEQGRSFDAAIAVDHMTLAAVNEGLSTCWVGWFDRNIVKEILGIPKDIEVPILIPIGFADEIPAPRPRKPLDEIISKDNF